MLQTFSNNKYKAYNMKGKKYFTIGVQIGCHLCKLIVINMITCFSHVTSNFKVTFLILALILLVFDFNS